MTLPRLLRTASFRLAAIYVAIFAASALLLGATVFLAARSALHQQMTSRIETETEFLREEFVGGGLDRLAATVVARGRGASALDYLLLHAGHRLAGEMATPTTPPPGWVTLETNESPEDAARPEQVRALVSDLGGGVVLAVGDDLGRITSVEEAVATALLWTVALAGGLGIAGGALLSRAFLARVDAISRTAEAIIDGDLGRRIAVRGTNDDLDRLAATLNRMLDRIGMLMERMRQFSSDVAHDLRTPLSRLLQRLEDARARAASMADHDAAVAAAVTEAGGLLETFSALLRVAQVEGGAARALFRAVDVSAIAETVVDAYRPDAEEAGHRLVAELEPGAVLHGDAELLTQALSNLVENALRHTPEGSRIVVRLCRDGDSSALSVEDDGPGVDAADLPRLADRFYRADRSRSTPGNGLGLSLVAAVADLHGASLRMEGLAPGLRATLRFA